MEASRSYVYFITRIVKRCVTNLKFTSIQKHSDRLQTKPVLNSYRVRAFSEKIQLFFTVIFCDCLSASSFLNFLTANAYAGNNIMSEPSHAIGLERQMPTNPKIFTSTKAATLRIAVCKTLPDNVGIADTVLFAVRLRWI